MRIIDITVPESTEIDLEESRAAMNQMITDRLGINRVEFLERLDRGEYANSDDLEVLHLITLAPFAR